MSVVSPCMIYNDSWPTWSIRNRCRRRLNVYLGVNFEVFSHHSWQRGPEWNQQRRVVRRRRLRRGKSGPGRRVSLRWRRWWRSWRVTWCCREAVKRWRSAFKGARVFIAALAITRVDQVRCCQKSGERKRRKRGHPANQNKVNRARVCFSSENRVLVNCLLLNCFAVVRHSCAILAIKFFCLYTIVLRRIKDGWQQTLVGVTGL